MGLKMDKEVIINGGLRAKKRDIVLTVYSTPLARLLMDKKINSVDVKYTSNLFIIKKGTQRSICMERKKEKHPLPVIHVGRFIPSNLLFNLRSKRKQRKVKVLLKNIVDKKDLLSYNRLIKYTETGSLKLNIPPSEKIKVGCHVSCFRHKSGFNYRLSIRHRILKEIAIKKEKVLITRNRKGEFILKKSEKGRAFNFYKNKKGHPLAYMQVSPSLITEEENRLFKSGKRCVSSRAYLSNKEFDLDISKFFMTKDERELAYALLKRNINVRIPEMRKREADIILKDSGIQIEVTHLKPREKETHHNSPHTDGVHINARLCEGHLRVKKNLTPLYLVVFNKKWIKYKWVNDLIRMVQPCVRCITTNFEYDWEEKVADKINLILEQEGFKK